jgi:uncharacterized membrane protein
VTGPAHSELPIDPTYPPAAYERVARLLRYGILGFLVLASAGLIGQLVLNPSESVGSILASGPSSGQPDALIFLGIYVMVGVTIGRVALATRDLYRGGERALGALSTAVIVLLLIALFVVASFVH